MNAITLFEHQHLKVETCSEDYPDDILLTQIDFAGEEARIQINKSQVRHLAEAAGVLKPLVDHLQAPSKSPAGGDSMQQLEVEVDDDGAIHLLQTKLQGMGGSDEEIELHPMQAAWLVAKLQSLLGRSQSSEEDKLVRRLIVLREKIAEFAAHDDWQEIMDHCGEGCHMMEVINNIVALADEFLIESGAEQTIEGRTDSVTLEKVGARETAGVTPTSTVTDTVTPRSSNAERQARYRARQKELALDKADVGA